MIISVFIFNYIFRHLLSPQNRKRARVPKYKNTAGLLEMLPIVSNSSII